MEYYYIEVFLLGVNNSIQRVYFNNGSRVPELELLSLIPGGRYRIHVANIAGGRLSKKITTEETLDPMQMQNLQIFDVGTDYALLTFDASPGIVDSFELTIAAEELPDFIIKTNEVKVVNGTVNALVRFSDLNPGKSYIVSGIAKSGQANSSPATFTFTTEKLSPRPGNVRVEDLTSTSFTVRWDEHEDAESYSAEVYLITPSGGRRRVYGGFGLTRSEAFITGLNPGSFYSIEVSNIVDGKTSEMVTINKITTPNSVASMTQVGSSLNNIRFLFVPGEGSADQFTFSIARENAPNVQIFTKTVDVENGKVNNVIVFDNLSPDTQYIVTGFATSGNVNSASMSELFKTVGDAPDPTNVQLVDVTSNSFTVRWDQADNVQYYFCEVFYVPKEGVPVRVYFNNGSRVPDVRLPNLSPGGTYRVEVANIGANGKMSNRFIITETLEPPSIQDLQVFDVGDDFVTITFGISPGISDSFEFSIALREDSSRILDFREVKVADGSVNNLVRFPNLDPGREYIITGVAKSGNKSSSPVTIDVKTETPLGSPKNLRIFDVTSTSFVVQWDRMDGADVSFIYVCQFCPE
ncbi:fibronectin-like [Styela clava]